MSNNLIFSLQKVSHSYSEDQPSAVRDLSLDIIDGESLVLLGANGSGKSTLLKLLAGLLFPQQGTFSAFGRVVSAETLRNDKFGMFFRKEVGVVFQNPDVQLFNPTVNDEVVFGMRQLNLTRENIEAKKLEMLSLFNIEALAMRQPFALSGGEKKKVALASVLALDPSVLILDEPTASLDPRSAYELIGHLVKLRAAGKTLVTATHDLHLVSALASRVIVIGENKEILADAAPESVLQNRTLLTSANLIHAHQHIHDGHYHAHEHTH